MGYDSNVSLKAVGSTSQLKDKALLSQSIENTAGAYNLELLDSYGSELAWDFQGRNTTAASVRGAFAEIADHYAVTLRIDYMDAFTDPGDQTVFYVGPGADVEYAADYVKAISQHVEGLMHLVADRGLQHRLVADMLERTNLEPRLLSEFLNILNKKVAEEDARQERKGDQS